MVPANFRPNSLKSVKKFFERSIQILMRAGFIIGMAILIQPSQMASTKIEKYSSAPYRHLMVTPEPNASTLIGARPSTTIYLPLIKYGRDNFLYGVFDAGGFVGNPINFEKYINDWQSRDFDAALLINDVPDLSVSDRMKFKVIASPLDDLLPKWFYYEDYHNGEPLCGGNITIDCARRIIGPIVDLIKGHPSVSGYYIFDDANEKYKDRIRLAVQVFKERDALNPTSPGMIELALGQAVYDYVRPEVFIMYNNPARNAYPPCDFREGGYRDWAEQIRETTQVKPLSTPLWLILQAHGSASGKLRTPTVEEVRLLNWLALGEDAKGIFWFSWTTDPDQFWIGLRDNPALLAEVTDLANRVKYLESYLSTIHKVSDKFQISPSNIGYVSTLKNFSSGKLYVLAVNKSCTPQDLTVSSWFYNAKLKDLESGSIIDLGAPLFFRGGDGKLFEVIDAELLPLPQTQDNLVKNASFESDSNNDSVPDQWYPQVSAIRDTSVWHSGHASLRVTGPSSTGSPQKIILKPDTKYYVSWYMKAQNLVESRLGIQYWQTSPSTMVLDSVLWNQNGSYDWVKRVGFFTTPKDYVTGQLIIGWNIASGSTYWIDDLTLCEADQPCIDSYLAE